MSDGIGIVKDLQGQMDNQMDKVENGDVDLTKADEAITFAHENTELEMGIAQITNQLKKVSDLGRMVQQTFKQ